MINSKMSKKTGRAKQLGLWENIVPDPGPTLKSAMNEAIKSSSLSRAEIVDRINQLAATTGITCNGRSQRATTSLLDKWLAPGATAYHIPLRLLPLFCRALGNNLPIEVYATFFQGIQVISDSEYRKLEWAEAELSARAKRKLASRLAEEVKHG